MTRATIAAPVQQQVSVIASNRSAMRIVHVVASLEIGGLERVVVDLACEQRRSGHDVRIYCVYRKGPLASEANDLGIPVSCFNKTNGISPGTLASMSQCLRKLRPDVVHTHNTLVHHYGVVAAKFAGVPHVINTRHGLGSLQPQSRAERIFRATLGFTNTVVMVSENTRELVTAQCKVDRKKTRTIRNGIPVERFIRYQAWPGLSKPRIRFGTIGRLAEIKDHITLIRAFAVVSTTFPQAELHILGDGPMRPTLEQLITKLAVGDRVWLSGASTKTGEFLASLDIFVLSSSSEGLPIVVLEAMAAGLPIIATRVGGTIEVAPEGEVAWYCPPGSPEALAQTMLDVARKPDLLEIGAAAHRIAMERFSIRRMATEYEECYRRVC